MNEPVFCLRFFNHDIQQSQYFVLLFKIILPCIIGFKEVFSDFALYVKNMPSPLKYLLSSTCSVENIFLSNMVSPRECLSEILNSADLLEYSGEYLTNILNKKFHTHIYTRTCTHRHTLARFYPQEKKTMKNVSYPVDNKV